MDGVNELPDDLAKALAALDARAADAAARVDAERVAERVLGRLRTEPVVARPHRTWTAMRIAAAIAVLVTGGVVAKVALDGGRSAVVATLPVDVPESVSTQQAAAVLDAVAASADSAVVFSASVTVDDLSEAELRTLLQVMQSDMEGAL